MPTLHPDRRADPRPARAGQIVRLALATLALSSVAAAGVPGVGRPAPGSDPGLRSVTLGSGSAITFHASDAFGGFDGKAPIAAFSLRLNPDRLASARGSVEVKTGAITTGNFLRDVNAARTVFQSSQYPTIRYTLESVRATPASLPDGGAADLTVVGRLRMHGVERSEVAHGTVRRSGTELDVTLSFVVRLSDYGMTRPRLFTVVVDDAVQVHVHVTLHMAASTHG